MSSRRLKIRPRRRGKKPPLKDESDETMAWSECLVPSLERNFLLSSMRARYRQTAGEASYLLSLRERIEWFMILPIFAIVVDAGKLMLTVIAF